MIRALRRRPPADERAAFEAALDRGVERVLHGAGPAQEASTIPHFAFELRPLLDVASELRSAVERPLPTAPGRAELIARLHWTPQQRPSLLVRLRSLRREIARDLAEAGLAMSPQRFAVPAGALALIVVMALALASGGGSASAATLTILDGRVEVHTAAGWRPLADGAAVATGDRLRLTANSAALLTFPDGSVLHLQEHADIEVTRAAFEGARDLAIDQRAGQVDVRVPLDGRPGASFTLSAPGAVVQVEAGTFTAEVTSDGTQIEDVSGRVAIHRESSEGVARLEPAATHDDGDGEDGQRSDSDDAAVFAVDLRDGEDGDEPQNEADDHQEDLAADEAGVRPGLLLGAAPPTPGSNNDEDEDDLDDVKRDGSADDEDERHELEQRAGRDERRRLEPQTVLPPLDRRIFRPTMSPTPTLRDRIGATSTPAR